MYQEFDDGTVLERDLEVAIIGWGVGKGANAAEEALKRKRFRAATAHASGSEIGKFSRRGVGGAAAAASVEVLALRVRQQHMKGARREQIYGGGIKRVCSNSAAVGKQAQA